MTNYGHNETAVRLAALAGDAQIALGKVSKGEADAIDGWLAYGAALNEGRALFAGDREFGQWKAENVLSQVGIAPKADEEVAAMWAAANADQLAEAKAASKARTLRGWHDQWKKIEQEREAARQKAEREAEQARKREEATKEAEEQAKVEAEARAEAAAAPTDDAREQAEAKAEQAAAAKVEAEKVVQEVEAEIAATEEIDPETAKLRREVGKLTPEAMVDEIIGLRADVAERKVTIKELRDEVAALKSEISLYRQDNLGRALGNEKRRADAADGRMREHQANAARLQRQVNAQKAEIERLKKEAENQMIPL